MKTGSNQSNIYQPPKSATQAIRSHPAMVRAYLVFSGVVTIIALMLCEMSLIKVRLLLPEYPGLVTVGSYMPLPPVHFFHSIGATGLLVVFLAAYVVTIVDRKLPVPPLLLRAVAALHLAFLGSAALAYGFCLWRISRVLALLR